MNKQQIKEALKNFGVPDEELERVTDYMSNIEYESFGLLSAIDAIQVLRGFAKYSSKKNDEFIARLANASIKGGQAGMALRNKKIKKHCKNI